ncbi:MAG: hypothetical protein ACPGID_11760, partial [Rubricella sp.]
WRVLHEGEAWLVGVSATPGTAPICTLRTANGAGDWFSFNADGTGPDFLVLGNAGWTYPGTGQPVPIVAGFGFESRFLLDGTGVETAVTFLLPDHAETAEMFLGQFANARAIALTRRNEGTVHRFAPEGLRPAIEAWVTCVEENTGP